VFRGKWNSNGSLPKTFKKDNPALLCEKEIYLYTKTRIAKSLYQDAYKDTLSFRHSRANMVRPIALPMSWKIPVESLSQNFNISTYKYLAIIFQLLYIYVLMNMFGITHNDVHLGNIISMPRKPSGNVFHRFDYNGQVFDISPYGIMYNCKIRDFDRASSTFQDILSLVKTGLCRDFGQCNRKDSEKDVSNNLILIHMFKPNDAVMKSFNLLLWEEMSRVNEAATKEMKSMVMQIMTTGSNIL